MANSGNFVFTFGKYSGQSIDKIASSDEGLLYLDWFVGIARAPHIKSKLQEFLKQPEIQHRLNVLVDD